MKGLIANIGWVLVGLLVLSGILISAGRQDYQSNPSPYSLTPSGTAALNLLLVRSGYTVRVDRSERPQLKPNEVALAFAFKARDLEDVSGDQEILKAQSALQEGLPKGATLFWLPLDRDFQAASLAAKAPIPTVRVSDNEPRNLTLPKGDEFASSADVAKEPSSVAGLLDQNEEASIFWLPAGKGVEVRYANALGLTNRFLDKADNAQVFLEFLGSVAPPGTPIVFVGATYGDVQRPGLLELIGPWAEPAWYQLLFLLLIMAITLGKRFGLPDEYRPLQKGARELLDAVADMLARAKAGRSALVAAIAESDAKLRASLKLPRDASEGERNRLLPQELLIAFAEANAAVLARKVPPKEALRLARNLEQQVEAVVPTRAVAYRPKRRRPAA